MLLLQQNFKISNAKAFTVDNRFICLRTYLITMGIDANSGHVNGCSSSAAKNVTETSLQRTRRTFDKRKRVSKNRFSVSVSKQCFQRVCETVDVTSQNLFQSMS